MIAQEILIDEDHSNAENSKIIILVIGTPAVFSLSTRSGANVNDVNFDDPISNNIREITEYVRSESINRRALTKNSENRLNQNRDRFASSRQGFQEGRGKQKQLY